MFTPNTYRQRRSDLMNSLPSQGIILLLGNEESPMNCRDNVYRFRQDSSFLYYFGIDNPGLCATLDLSTGECTLYGEEATLDHVIWMGPQPSLTELAERSGGLLVKEPKALSPRLSQAKQRKETIHYLPPYRGENILKLIEWLEISHQEVLQGPSRPLIEAVVAQRSIKTQEELDQLEQACSRTTRMHLQGMRLAQPHWLESQVMAAVRAVPLAEGQDTSFPIICSKNSEVLHNHFHGNLLQAGDLLLLDAGAESDLHYAGDMTRTFPISARFSQQQKDLYEVALEGQLHALSLIRPGVTYREIHLACAKSMTLGLQALGLMKGDADESVAAGAHALLFPHGLGHMLGLDVHDMEDLGEDLVGYAGELTRSTQFGLKSLRLGRTLRTGFVLTVEPGIYLISALIQRWKSAGQHAEFINYKALEAYENFGGIRIEDDVVVTMDGYRILGDPLPKSVEAIEDIRQEALS